jgi:hypothetical protein
VVKLLFDMQVERMTTAQIVNSLVQQKPGCAFDTEKTFCKIAQGGEICNFVTICSQASTTPDEITPIQFCENNPEWTIEQAIGLYARKLNEDPTCNVPFNIINSYVSRMKHIEKYKLKKLADEAVKKFDAYKFTIQNHKLFQTRKNQLT